MPSSRIYHSIASSSSSKGSRSMPSHWPLGRSLRRQPFNNQLQTPRLNSPHRLFVARDILTRKTALAVEYNCPGKSESRILIKIPPFKVQTILFICFSPIFLASLKLLLSVPNERTTTTRWWWLKIDGRRLPWTSFRQSTSSSRESVQLQAIGRVVFRSAVPGRITYRFRCRRIPAAACEKVLHIVATPLLIT